MSVSNSVCTRVSVLVMSAIYLLSVSQQSLASENLPIRDVLVNEKSVQQFQGRPTAVQGLKLKILDFKNYSRIQLDWRKNKESENVDKYAIYELDDASPDGAGGSLQAIVKGSSFMMNTFASGSLSSKQPNSMRIDPGLSTKIWVIAHNQHGWGVNAFKTAGPDNVLVTVTNKNLLLANYPNILYQDWPCSQYFSKLHQCFGQN